MTPAFDRLQQLLKQLPGLGFRSAERIALHLLVEKPERRQALLKALSEAGERLTRCERCGNLCERDLTDNSSEPESICAICSDETRKDDVVCVVERVPDLIALERSGAFRGRYHILYGKLSPIQGVGEKDLNMASLRGRVGSGEIKELILALSNDIEGEATCHFIQDEIVGDRPVQVTRIGFGLPSGTGIGFADPTTLRSALDGRRELK